MKSVRISAAVCVCGGVAGLVACSGHVRPEGADAAVAYPAHAPEDFWISVTVLGPVRTGGADGKTAYQLLAPELRPGRYVIEPDRILRASIGPGAKEALFPPPTRRLTGEQIDDLWRATTQAGLMDANNPDATPHPAGPDPETIKDKTVYVITTHATGVRRTVSTEAEPECGPGCLKARTVVAWLAKESGLRP